MRRLAPLLRPDRLIVIGTLAILVGLVALILVVAVPAWFWHPLGVCAGSAHQQIMCRGYNFWSGIGSDVSEVTLPLGMVVFLLGWWHHHNCHYDRCPRLGHPHPEHGWPACRTHWSEVPAHIANGDGRQSDR